MEGPMDCTLACDGGHLTAHKLILCAHSKYIQDLLRQYPDVEHPIIVLIEVNIIDVRILVNYMYTGELVITNDDSPASILRTAQILKIDSLTDFDDDEDEEIDVDITTRHQPTQTQLPPTPPTTTTTTTTTQSQHNQRHHQLQLQHQQQLQLHQQLLLQQQQQHNQRQRHQQSQQQLQQHHHPLDADDDDDVDDEQLDLESTLDQTIQKQHDSINSPLSKDNNNKIRCHLCNIGLSDVKCLYRHVLTRHLPEKWGYKCEFCDREFSRDDHLMRHYTTKHKNMEFNREKIRETRRLNREMAKNFHDQISTI